MSPRRADEPLRGSPAAQSDTSLLIQEKLSARQAKRAAKAAERREKSDALKEEGNTFFRNGDFQNALNRYQQAIDVHGPSQKPILLANLAATYLKLGMYSEAHETADKALSADPTSVKARYRRGMARKHLQMWAAAEIDFRTLLDLDPRNKSLQNELAIVEEQRSECPFWDEEEDMNSYSDYEAPALEDDPDLGESLSESSDCEHMGNNIPCKFYNRTECKNGRSCRYSHAPDKKSERDALGRNVCRYYLMGVCKFSERCSYLHSKEYLLHNGWWSTAEWINREKKKYDLLQMFNKAIADYNNQTRGSGTGQSSKKKQPKGKKKVGHGPHADLGAGASSTSAVKHSSQRVGRKSQKKRGYSVCEGYGFSEDDDENGMCGFTGSEVEELLCHGVKPWDDDAWDVMDALRSYY